MRAIGLACLLSASLTVNAAALGPNVIQDGDLSDGQGWSLGSGWYVLPGTCPANGLAWHAEGATSAIFRAPASPMLAGATYRVTYTVSGTSGASDPKHWIRIRGDSTVNTPISIGDGTFTFDIAAPANVTIIGLVGGYGFAGVVDDISVREVNP